MAQDLRTFLVDLEKKGLLIKFSREVDLDVNAGAYNWNAVVKHKKAILCDRIKNYPGWKTTSGIIGTREEAAVALGYPVGTLIPKLAEKVRTKGLTPPKMVEDGPIKEIIRKGAKVDLNALPVNIIQEGDAGRYIGSGMLICRDPETGILNVSVHRHQIKGKDKMGVLMSAGKHARMIYDKYRARKEPMPVAIVIGHHPAVILAATWSTGMDVNEFEIAGTLLNEPLEMVRGEMVDLEIPAYGEIVLEGEVPHDIQEEEGPFGEHSGCTIAGTGMNPIVKVKAITMRRGAIFHQITEGPSTEGAILDSIPMEVEIFNHARNVGGGVDLRNVVVHEFAGAGHIVTVQMVPQIPGQATGVLMAVLSSTYIHPKIAIAVDDDVDPFNAEEVLWAVSTKVNPVDDVFIIKKTLHESLDSSIPSFTPKGFNPIIRLGSRMGIDATKPSLWEKQERAEMARILPKGFQSVDLKELEGK